MTYSITLNKPMAIFKDAKQENYKPMGEWDWTNLSEIEIKEELEELDRQADECFAKGDYLPADVFFRKFEEDHDICAMRS